MSSSGLGLSALTDTWTRPRRGALFVVSGASGSGKTTLLRAALQTIPGLEFSVSATTRTQRPGERAGVDYHYHSHEEFRSLLANQDLLEHASVYDNYYGTPRGPVNRALSEGRSIVLDIDVQGAAQVRVSHPEAVSLFVLAPSRAAMEARLRARGDAPEVIARRMAQADGQLAEAHHYDYVVLNDNVGAAHAQMQAVLVAELLRTNRRLDWIEQVFPAR
jgi:guanylate kinase